MTIETHTEANIVHVTFRKSPSWWLVVWWALTFAFDFLAGIATYFGISDNEQQMGNPAFGAIQLAMLVATIVMAITQGLVLRYHTPYIKWSKWTGATLLGYTLAFGLPTTCAMLPRVAAPTGDYSSGSAFTLIILQLAISVFLSGAIGAFPQSRLLAQSLPNANAWLLANIIAIPVALSACFADPPESILHMNLFLRVLVMGLSIGTTIGAITGILLAYLLRRRVEYKQLRKHNHGTPFALQQHTIGDKHHH